jgi:hypothetical protein
MPRALFVASPRAMSLRVAAACLLVIGYADLVRGGSTIAALALVAGYVLLVPMALLAE